MYKKVKLCKMIPLMLLLFLLTACNGNSRQEMAGNGTNTAEQDADAGQDAGENNGTEENTASDGAVSWQASYSQLGNPYLFALAADDLYGYYIRNDQVLLDIIDRQSFSVKETLALPDASFLAGMAADGEGNVCLLGNRLSESGDESMGLWKIDTKGALQDFVELELEDTERADDLSLKGIYTDEDGTLFVWCEMIVPGTEVIEGRESEVWHWEDRVYVKDRELQTLFYEKIADMKGTQVLNFQVGTDGRPVFTVKDSDGIYTQEIDVAQKGRKEEVRLEKAGALAERLNDMENLVSVPGGLLYCMDNGLYEFRFDTQEADLLFHLPTYGIYSSDILFLAKRGDNIELIDNHGEGEPSEFVSFALGKSDKQLLTLGAVMAAGELEKAVAEFNRFSSEYRVEIVDYYHDMDYYHGTEDYEKALEQLKLDVVTGKAPDIFEVAGLDYVSLSGKGVLADLYDFMREDGECSRDMQVQSVLRAYEDDGHLYNIAPGFQLHSMWGYGDVTGGRSGVTFEELFRLLAESGKDLNAIGGFSGDEPVLTRLCTVSMDEFVDWESGTCDFEGDYFKEVLSFAKEYTGSRTGGSYIGSIRNREVVLTVGIISSVADYQIQKELYGEDVGFLGYPVAEGTGTAVTFRGNDVAINAKGKNQEGAWEFVKFYLLHGYDGQGFPMVKEQLEQMLDASMEEIYSASEDGRSERIPKGTFYGGEEAILVYAAAQEDVDAVRRLVEGAENRVEFHPVIQGIINEEAEGYFSGQMDLDSTVEKIQNRVTLFLQESL